MYINADELNVKCTTKEVICFTMPLTLLDFCLKKPDAMAMLFFLNSQNV